MEALEKTRLKRLVLVAGLSGAGKSTALKSLEDLGFTWVDNPPIQALPQMVEQIAAEQGAAQLAVGLHLRGQEDALQHLDAAHSPIYALITSQVAQFELLYLEAQTDLLVKRYRETRRRHPLGNGLSIMEAIEQERELMAPFRERADMVIDTTHLRPRELQSRLGTLFQEGAQHRELTLFLRSFGFKYGTNTDADMVLDSRFLCNPYYEPQLRDLTGLDEPVQQFLERDGEVSRFLTHLEELFLYLIPRYMQENKCYFTADIGCTGGHHRSVYLVEQLRERLAAKGYLVHVRHRDIER
uniref:Uncharacterized protein n=1 Tax=Magnetococcus massalia (strain MO-1) TaxID=451514 RepID=A0A1S7LQH8_MAGMO|nr:conserved protein of unknown function [Candidatus Magnetococcus massalia]